MPIEILFLVVFGLVIGSFLNVVIYRISTEQKINYPKRSQCPGCNYHIKWFENIPVFSYLFLKGKCSNCNTQISIIYPVVEIITAIGTVYLFEQFHFSLNFVLHWLLLIALICLSFIDIKLKAVPDYFLIVAVLLALFAGQWEYGLLFMGGAFLLQQILDFYIQNIKARLFNDESLKEQQAMGEGDIPIFGILGAILGAQLGVTAVFFAAIFALTPAVYNLIKKQEIETPFIPFLVIGMYFVMITQINLFSLFV